MNSSSSSKSILTGAVRLGFVFALVFALRVMVAQTLIEDSFTLNGTTRIEGGRLHSTIPSEKTLEGSSWRATDTVVFTSSGTIGTTAGKTGGARINIGSLTTVTTVSADIFLDDAMPAGQWVAVGFLDSTTTWGEAANSTLSLAIQRNGSWHVYYNGTSNILATGVVAGFSTNMTYTLSLSYEPTGGIVSAYIFQTGTTETLQPIYTGNASGKVDSSSITAAGFRIHVNNNTATIDNFLVAIPEPHVAALGLGALAMLAACVVTLTRR